MSKRASRLHKRVVALAQERFPSLRPADFGDPLLRWDGTKINGKDKKLLAPLERLGHRGSFLLQHLREVTVPLVKAGARMGFYRRLGPDTYIGAIAYAEDPEILQVWEGFVKIGIVRLGLAPPLYFWVDGDTVLRKRLDEYCERLPGQRYVSVSAELSEEDAARRIMGHVNDELVAHGQLAAA